MLYGEEAAACWTEVTKRLDAVVTMPRECPLLQTLVSIHQEAAAARIRDGYQAAAHAYAFIMELYRHAVKNTGTAAFSPPIAHSINYVRTCYDEDISLEHLAQQAELSKYHFARLFLKETGTTPMKYVAKIRMEAAVRLLRETTLPVAEIADRVGFASGNYFGKVFQYFAGMTPSQFRSSRNRVPVDHFTFD